MNSMEFIVSQLCPKERRKLSPGMVAKQFSDKTRDAVLNAIGDGATSEFLSSKIGISDRQVRRILEDCIKRGQVRFEFVKLTKVGGNPHKVYRRC